MAYSGTTFVASTSVSSADLQGNLDGMRNYVDNGVLVADIDTTPWVEAKHLMRGSYQPIVNSHSFPSGLVCGRTSANGDLSFIPDGPTYREGNVPTYKFYPNGTLDFFLPQSADVLFQFHAVCVPRIVTAATNQKARIKVFLDDVSVGSTKMWAWTEQESVGNVIDDARYRHEWSNFYLAKNLSAGHHTVSLKGYTRNRYAFMVNWSLALEAYFV